jgi:type IV pilus assembly protein PilB
MMLYDPPKQVVYEDISIAGEKSDGQRMIDSVSETLAKVRPDDMLAYLVQQAYKLKASDIHIENQKENVRVRFRIDGVLHPVAYIDHEKYRHMSSAVASAANISTGVDEAQTGHISSTYKLATGEEVQLNLRVESIPAVYGMDVVMRLFNMRHGVDCRPNGFRQNYHALFAYQYSKHRRAQNHYAGRSGGI